MADGYPVSRNPGEKGQGLLRTLRSVGLDEQTATGTSILGWKQETCVTPRPCPVPKWQTAIQTAMASRGAQPNSECREGLDAPCRRH